jgi:phosphoserine phosphatase
LFANRIIKKGLYSRALRELKFIKKNGHQIILASASLDIYVDEIGKLLNFTKVISTKVEIDKQNKITKMGTFYFNEC